MPTHLETVLATAPVFYGGLDELTGDTLIDLSGNGYHGTYFNDAVRGLASPIESDASSFAVGSRVGVTPAPASVDGFSWSGWFYYADNISASGIVCRNGQIGLPGSNMMTVDHGLGLLGVRLNPDANPFVFYDLSFPLPVVNQWYWGLVTRNGPVMTLWLNAVIVAQRTDLPSGSFTSPLFISGAGVGWKIGVTGDSGNVFGGVGTDDVIIHDYPITQADATAIYESALNQLLLHGRSDVVVSSTLSSTIDPTPTSFPFRHNWTEPLIERLAFRTGLSSARTGVEEGNEQRVAPRRELEFTQVLRTNTERRKFRALLWANQHAKWFVPVRQDAGRVVAGLTTGATTIPVDTSYKDYEIGSYIGLRQLDARGNITHREEQVIVAVNPTTIECTPITYNYSPMLSWAYPVRRALLPPSVTVRGHTDAVEESTITFRLLPEDESAGPARITPWTPTIKYRDYEVFDPSIWPTNDWSDSREYDVSRETSEVDFSSGLLGVESDTNGATESIPWRIKTKGRSTIARFLGWFYERRGRSRYLWVPTEQSDFEVLGVDGADLTVADTNYSDAFALAEARRDLAFIYHDGTMVFRRVVGFSGTVNETLTLDAFVLSLANLRSVSLLKFCRLDGDQIEIAWHTDDTVEIAWAFRELLHTPEGTGVSSLSPSPSVSVSLSPSGSASPSSSTSLSRSPSGSGSPSGSTSPSGSVSPSHSASASTSPSLSPSHSSSPSV